MYPHTGLGHKRSGNTSFELDLMFSIFTWLGEMHSCLLLVLSDGLCLLSCDILSFLLL